jgi:uncharacterized protein
MTTSCWRESVVAYIQDEARPVDKYGHQPRLYALARQLGQGLAYDDDVLFAAGWMHDLGVFLGHRPEDPEALKHWDHVPYTVERSRALLALWGFPAAKLDAVAEAIRTHRPQDDPQMTEAILLRDADILEQLGAVGILRAVVKVGRDTRYATFSSVTPVLRSAVMELPGKLRLSSARKAAVARIETTRVFLSAIDDEAGTLLY